MRIIIGLGNPGEKYKLTRHNIGFMAIDALAKKLEIGWEKSKKLNAEIAKNKEVILVKPLTYMNNSGETVQAILKYYKVPPLTKGAEGDLKDILTVIHDDIDIELGKYKIAIDSRAAGHNGVQSIIDQLGSKKFSRYRLGIRSDFNQDTDAEKFILEKPASSSLRRRACRL